MASLNSSAPVSCTPYEYKFAINRIASLVKNLRLLQVEISHMTSNGGESNTRGLDISRHTLSSGPVENAIGTNKEERKAEKLARAKRKANQNNG